MFAPFGLWLDMLLCSVLQHRLRIRSWKIISRRSYWRSYAEALKKTYFWYPCLKRPPLGAPGIERDILVGYKKWRRTDLEDGLRGTRELCSWHHAIFWNAVVSATADLGCRSKTLATVMTFCQGLLKEECLIRVLNLSSHILNRLHESFHSPAMALPLPIPPLRLFEIDDQSWYRTSTPSRSYQ